MAYIQFCEVMRQYGEFTDEQLQEMWEAEMLVERADAMIACGI